MTFAAAELGAGGTAFAVVLALIIAMAGIFWAMIRSFRRLRQSVAQGTFGQAEKLDLKRHDDSTPQAPAANAADPVSHDQTPGGASV